MSLSISEWFGGDGGGGEPRKVRSDGADLTIAERFGQDDAPPSVATQPVTPAERHLATILRTWLVWNAPDGGPDHHGNVTGTLSDLGDVFAKHGFVHDADGAATDAGRDLIARVDAAERTPATVLRATLNRLRDAINNPPDGDDNDWKSAMRAALREHEAALAGTAPVDAPPRKPDR